MSGRERLAILVGGGPAPGINSAISAATIRGVLEGAEVVGIQDGFEWIMRGDPEHHVPLTIREVSRIHSRGGSLLGTSRANPTGSEQHLESCVRALCQIGATTLITIGGDDTAYAAMMLGRASGGAIRVAHVPKTIDNDLDIGEHADTIGFQTARHVGAELLKNLMADARATSRWHFVVTMGRKTGHLALGIGKAAGATLTLIPEEFQPAPVLLREMADTLAGAMIKRLSYGRRDGVAVLAEGLALLLDPSECAGLEAPARDSYGNIRVAEFPLGELLRSRVDRVLREFGVESSIAVTNLGYDLRGADPIPYDMEYARDLGYCAAEFLLSGGSESVVVMKGGQFRASHFRELVDPASGRIRIRPVNIRSTRYAIARRYMIRLRRDDFAREREVAVCAAVCGLDPADFRSRFEPLVRNEPPPLVLEEEKSGAGPRGLV